MDDDSTEIRPGVCVSEHENGLAIFDSGTGRVFVCNLIGAQIWAALSKGLGIDTISAGIAQRFGASPNDVKHDACLFVAELECEGLIVRRIDKS